MFLALLLTTVAGLFLLQNPLLLKSNSISKAIAGKFYNKLYLVRSGVYELLTQSN